MFIEFELVLRMALSALLEDLAEHVLRRERILSVMFAESDERKGCAECPYGHGLDVFYVNDLPRTR